MQVRATDYPKFPDTYIATTGSMKWIPKVEVKTVDVSYIFMTGIDFAYIKSVTIHVS